MRIIPNKYGTHSNANQLKPRFGIKQTENWPAEGMPPREICGYVIFIKPRKPGRDRPHRCTVICPHCENRFSYGRLSQHLKIHTED